MVGKGERVGGGGGGFDIAWMVARKEEKEMEKGGVRG